jgi:hypothetical protein
MNTLTDFLTLSIFADTIFIAFVLAYYVGQKSIRRSECFKIGKEEGVEEGINMGIQRARIAHALGKSLDTETVQNKIEWIGNDK